MITTEYIETRSCPEPNTGCWLWLLSVNYWGYGRTRIANSSERAAHRLSFIAHNGPIPYGMKVLHRCDTPACVNPAHLFLGTNADNMRDMASKGRTGTRSGEANPVAKLTSVDVRRVREAHALGTRICVLAREYGVAWKTIKFIVRGDTWRK